MNKARKGIMRCSGELLHHLLGLPEDVEVLDTDIHLRGEGLPAYCVMPEGGNPIYVSWHDTDGEFTLS